MVENVNYYNDTLNLMLKMWHFKEQINHYLHFFKSLHFKFNLIFDLDLYFIKIYKFMKELKLSSF